MEQVPNFSANKKEHKTRDAVMGVVLAGLSFAHENVQAVEIPEGASWEEVRAVMLSEQKNTGVEQVAQLLIGANNEILSLPIQAGKNQADGINDLVLMDEIGDSKNSPGGYEKACVGHTHPKTPKFLYEPSVSFDMVARPSGYDLGVSKRHRQFTIEGKVLPMEHAVFLADGSIWYYQYDGSGDSANHTKNDDQVSQELSGILFSYVSNRDRSNGDITMDVMNFIGKTYWEYGFTYRYVPREFVNLEPPCAGTDYPVKYVLNGETGKWQIDTL